MSEDTIQCPKCGISISKDVDECPVCGAKLEESKKEMDGEEERILNALKQISGVGGYKAKNIVKSGISDFDKLEDASLESFLSVKGIGEATAKDIVDAIEDSTTKDGSLYLCVECGAFVSADADRCPTCGTKMDDEVEEGDVEAESEITEEIEDEERVDEEEEGSLYLCSNCGSFISESADECPYCGYSLEIEDEIEEDLEEEIEEELEPEFETDIEEEESEDGLFLCTNCGSFAGANAKRCPSCGMVFDEEEVEEETGGVEAELEMEGAEEEGVEEAVDEEEVAEEDVDIEEEVEEIPEEELQETTSEEIDIEDLIEYKTDETSEEAPEEEIDEPSQEEIDLEDLIEYRTEDTSEEISEEETGWTDEGLGIEVDESDLEELDREISEALKDEYGISTATLMGLSMGGDVKMCSNCGRLCEKDVPECPTCGAVFEDVDIELAEEDGEWKRSQDQKTLEKALGIQEVPDEIDVEDEDTELNICTVCGAFLTDKTERCGICGSLVSETPDLEVDEDDIYEVKKDDDSLYICDACGALVDEYQDRCPICGSVLELSRRSVEDEELEDLVDETGNVIEEFFGRTDDIALEEKINNDEINFCDVCGALLSEDADKCPICGEGKREEKDIEGFEYYFESEGDVTEEDMESLEEEILEEEFGFTEGDEVGTVQEEKEEEKLDEAFEEQVEETGEPVEEIEEPGQEVEEPVQEIEDEVIEEDEPNLEDLLIMKDKGDLDLEGGETVIDQLEQLEGEISKKMVEEDEDIDLDLDSTSSEDLIDLLSTISEGEYIEEVSGDEVEDELSLDEGVDEVAVEEGAEEDDIITVEEDEIYEGPEVIDSDAFQRELDEEVLEEAIDENIDVNQAIEDIDELVSAGEEEEYEEEEFYEEGEEYEDEYWLECPSCGSYVSEDSEVCGVCGLDFTEETVVEEETTSYEYEDIGVDLSELKEYKSEYKRSTWEEKGEGADTSKKTRSVPSVPSYTPQDKFKSVISKIKEYEVPISSLSLFAFGGVYLTSYGDSNLRYLTDIGLIILGIFFGMGLFTLFVLREDLKQSFLGVLGYFGALGIASFVPINNMMLGIDVPLILDVGLIAMALGVFWMLDYKLPGDYRYYLVWFSGISIIMLILVLAKFDDANGLMNLNYSVLMALGLGGILIASGTSSWYNRANSEEEFYGDIEKGHRHLIHGDYLNAVKSFDRSIEKGDVTKREFTDEENPAFPYYSKGLALCNMGEYKEAAKTFKQVLDINPKSVPTWNNLGTAFSRMGDQEKAVKCLKRAIKIDPGYEIAWNNLGNALFRMGNYEEALECYDEALDLNSSYRDASLNKTQCLTKISFSQNA